MDGFGERVLEDCGKLLHVRDHIVDWVLIESQAAPSDDFSEALIDTLERLRDLKSRPPRDERMERYMVRGSRSRSSISTFLYVIAALVKTARLGTYTTSSTSHYLMPKTERYGDKRFERFDTFRAGSQTLDAVLAPKGRRLLSPAAALVKRQAQRGDLPFGDIMQADLLALLMSLVTLETRWYPQILHYADHTVDFPLFLRASQHKHFRKLAAITGIESADALREAVRKGHERLGVDRWDDFTLSLHRSFWNMMNMDSLDTVK